ncbi:MAG: HAMP domain-containing histidine kinase [Coriobacteriales bacterium]|nr:HAMP domain-containing histidine kinase [Coriobacteriales bacterium]
MTSGEDDLSATDIGKADVEGKTSVNNEKKDDWTAIGQLADKPRQQQVPGLTSIPSFGANRLSNVARLTLGFIFSAVIAVSITLLIVMVLFLPSGLIMSAQDVVALIIGATLATIIATIIARITANGIINPLARISETVESYSLDNMSARTGFTGFDEIGRLGRSIDIMADKLADAYNYERQITVDLAHELRTPLMATQATLEAMIDKVMPSSEEQLITLHSEIVRLSRLVDAQLELSRLENRRVVVRAIEMDLGAEIEQLTLSFETFIEDAGITLDTDIERGLHVIADPDLIRQAVANLISNAVRYTPKGGTMEISVLKSGSSARIVIKDTGVGINKDDLEKIFTKFFRADEGRSREHGGLGIGLSLVKEIVDIHNGRVTARSVLGDGSAFFIDLPLAKTPDKKRK